MYFCAPILELIHIKYLAKRVNVSIRRVSGRTFYPVPILVCIFHFSSATHEKILDSAKISKGILLSIRHPREIVSVLFATGSSIEN